MSASLLVRVKVDRTITKNNRISNKEKRLQVLLLLQYRRLCCLGYSLKKGRIPLQPT